MAGLLPASYTTPIMSGQGLAGTFAAFAMICAIASLINNSPITHWIQFYDTLQELECQYTEIIKG